MHEIKPKSVVFRLLDADTGETVRLRVQSDGEGSLTITALDGPDAGLIGGVDAWNGHVTLVSLAGPARHHWYAHVSVGMN